MDKQTLYKTLDMRLLESFSDNTSLGLAHGKMGICIYYHVLGRLENNSEYYAIGEKLLNDISNNLNRGQSIDIESGLAGIALGIRFLIKNQYQTGDVDEILEDIDTMIYHRLENLEPYGEETIFSDSQIIQLLYYFYIRYEDSKENSDNRFFFKELIIQLINVLRIDNFQNFIRGPLGYSLYHYSLPVLLYVLSKIISLKIYNYKIYKILKLITPIILSHRPVLHSNRLYLLWGMLSISKNIQSEDWQKYLDELKNQIDINRILNNELKNQDIFFSNGIASLFCILNDIEKNYPSYKVNYDADAICDKIENSLAWKSLLDKTYFFKIHRGLFNGFTGLRLLLSMKYK